MPRLITVFRSNSFALLFSLLAMADVAANDGRSDGASPAHTILQASRPLVIAHRGFSAQAPENTVAAFNLALKAKPDLVELDYHHSQDGEVVVIHDSTLDRTTDAAESWGGEKLKVADYSLEQLRELDAGRWFASEFSGARLPSLADALDSIQRGSIALIERKAGDASTCVELIRAKALVNEVVVQSFDWDYLRDYRQSEPAQVLAALGPQGSRNGRKLSDDEKRLNTDWVDAVVEIGAQVVVWNRGVDRDAIEYAHQRGLKVWIYTINEAAMAEDLLRIGVDGIITDDPEMMRGVVDQFVDHEANP